MRRLVHVSSESAILSGRPLRGADETWPLQPRSRALYAASKARAELAIGEARGVETVIVTTRPGLGAR